MPTQAVPTQAVPSQAVPSQDTSAWPPPPAGNQPPAQGYPVPASGTGYGPASGPASGPSGYPPGYPASGYPGSGYPAAGYPAAGYPQPGYPGYPQPGYPQPGYPGAAAMPPGQAWAPQYPYASWWNRVVATLIDFAYVLPGYVLMIVGIILATVNAPTRSRTGVIVRPGNGGLVTVGIVLALVGLVGFAAVAAYNLLVVQGRTGQSWGKRHTGLRVIHEQTGQPLTIGMNFVRQLCHYLDGIAYIGYLWPIWDAKRQTFADKIMTTVVVKER